MVLRVVSQRAHTLERCTAGAAAWRAGDRVRGPATVRWDRATLETVWSGFVDDVGANRYQMATIELPVAPAETLSIRYLEPNPRHERAYSSVEVRIADGAIESHVRYADRSFGDRFMASIFPLHSGRYFGMAGVIVFMMASLAMPLFAITGWMLYLARRRRKKRGHAHVPGDAGLAADPACAGTALETDT